MLEYSLPGLIVTITITVLCAVVWSIHKWVTEQQQAADKLLDKTTHFQDDIHYRLRRLQQIADAMDNKCPTTNQSSAAPIRCCCAYCGSNLLTNESKKRCDGCGACIITLQEPKVSDADLFSLEVWRGGVMHNVVSRSEAYDRLFNHVDG